jgi:hypothetical protein
MIIFMNDAKNYLDDLYFFCDYCGKYKPQILGANFRDEPLYYQQGRKMRQVTMCLDCSRAPEYASTIKDAWCGPITEIPDAYEGILEVIREETTKNTTAARPIRFEDAVIKACQNNPDVREYLGRLSTLEDCIKSHMLWRFRYWITHGEEESKSCRV